MDETTTADDTHESVEGSPPSTDDGRRVEPALHDDHRQGGSTEPKLVRHVSWADMSEDESEETKLRRDIEKDMFIKTKKALMEIRKSSGSGVRQNRWPAHWKDVVHDEDGGIDMFGRRIQDGRRRFMQCVLCGGVDVGRPRVVCGPRCAHQKWPFSRAQHTTFS